ncbi:MFS transporter [Paenibacillus silviterrae]|uniref:MFS transporter n=1 Tax=Paenibacillus silviterrae TaxID=3242194 RepID=UPI002543A8A8|nr:MFS transporter [Paenibacillus chinjuensis]
MNENLAVYQYRLGFLFTLRSGTGDRGGSIHVFKAVTLLTAKQTGKSYASYRVWGSIGFASASMLFGLLLKESGIPAAKRVCIAIVVMTLLFAFLLEDRKASARKVEFTHIFPILTSVRFLWFLILVLDVSIAHRMNDSFIVLYLKELGAPETFIGWSWLLAAASEIPVFFLLGRYGGRCKPLHGLSYGIFLLTALSYMQELGGVGWTYRWCSRRLHFRPFRICSALQGFFDTGLMRGCRFPRNTALYRLEENKDSEPYKGILRS